MLKKLLLVGVLLATTGCDKLVEVWEQPTKQLEKYQQENQKLKEQVGQLRERLAVAEAEITFQKVVASLYDLRHALEKFAQKNGGKYPYANDINDLQTSLSGYLPDGFEIEAVYLKKARSQDKGYIMIGNVKSREIVVSNLL